MNEDTTALLAMTTGIIANYVSNNRVTPDELPALIASTHAALSNVGSPTEAAPEAAPERLTPAQVRKLITPKGITSLIDGRSFKSLKRHLTTAGHTPQSYRAHFGLPSDFPMVHPDYAAARSALAKAAGLGQGGRQPKKAEKPVRKTAKAKA